MIQVALERLRGRAANWATPFKVYPATFGEFSRRFLDAFDSAEIRVNLTAKFYGENLKESESSETLYTLYFILGRHYSL